MPLDVGRREAPGTAGAEGYRVFWGDLHVHSAYSSDFRPPRPAADVEERGDGDYTPMGQVYGHALSRGLDFVAATDHAEDLDAAEWEETRKAAARYDREGRFVPILGYEFCDSLGTTVRCANVLLPGLSGNGLYASSRLKKRGAGEAYAEGLTGIPELCSRLEAHEPGALGFMVYTDAPGRWNQSEAERRRLVGAEVSTTGGSAQTHEYRGWHPQVVEGFKAGNRLAVLGSSNTHAARPGEASLTAVLARDLSREAILDALRNRRTYATRGARILLSLDVDGRLMGDAYEAPPEADGRRTVRISAQAVHHDGPLTSLTVVRLRRGVKDTLARRKETRLDLDVAAEDGLAAGDSALYWVEATLPRGTLRYSVEAWSTPVFVRIPPR